MTSTETGFSGSWAPNASRANQMATIATAAPNSSNMLVARYIYDAWGNEASTSFDNLTVKNPIRYRGAEGYLHLYGPDACRGWSLYLAGARVYHTGVGRWLTEDPLLGNLGDPMSFNRYLYVNANPVDYSDPSGLEKIPHTHGDPANPDDRPSIAWKIEGSVLIVFAGYVAWPYIAEAAASDAPGLAPRAAGAVVGGLKYIADGLKGATPEGLFRSAVSATGAAWSAAGDRLFCRLVDEFEHMFLPNAPEPESPAYGPPAPVPPSSPRDLRFYR